VRVLKASVKRIRETTFPAAAVISVTTANVDHANDQFAKVATKKRAIMSREAAVDNSLWRKPQEDCSHPQAPKEPENGYKKAHVDEPRSGGRQ